MKGVSVKNYSKNKICLDCRGIKSDKGLYCKKCGYSHRNRPKGLKYNLRMVNKTWFPKGNIPWNIGVPSVLKKNNPSYDALHEWVERWLGKSSICMFCGGNINLEWANKSGKYLREKSDWFRLCKKCHCRYDYENFGAREIFYKRGVNI